MDWLLVIWLMTAQPQRIVLGPYPSRLACESAQQGVSHFVTPIRVGECYEASDG